MRLVKSLCAFFGAVLLLCSCSVRQPENGFITSIAIYDDTSAVLSAQQVFALPQQAFTPAAVHHTPGFITGAYWIALTLAQNEQNDSGNTVVIDFGPEIFDRADLYVCDINGTWQLLDSTGRLVPTYERRLATWRSALSVPLPTPAGGGTPVLIRLTSADSVHITLRAFTLSAFYDQTVSLSFIHAIILGILIVILVYLLFCFIWFREKLFLLVGLTSILFFVYQLVMKGFVHTYFWAAHANNPLNTRVSYIVSTFGFFCALNLFLVCIDFGKQGAARLFLKLLAVLCVIVSVLYLFAPDLQPVYLFSIVMLIIGCAFLCFFIVYTLVTKKGLTMNLLVAWVPLFLYVVFRQSWHLVRLYVHLPFLESFFDYDYYFSYDICYLFQLIVYTAVIQSQIGLEQKNRRMASERSYFFKSTAHELIAPATLVQQAAGELDHSSSLSADDRILVHGILGNCRRVLDMSVLLNSLEEQEQQIAAVAEKTLAVKPVAVLKQVIADFVWYARTQNKQIDLTCTVPDEFAVLIYPLFLETVFSNLLDNAIKYSFQHSRITIQLDWHGGAEGLICRVHNTGLSIDSKDKNALCNLRYRAQDAAEFSERGFGMGLHLVSRIAKLYKGDVRIESGSQNEGSTFTVHLAVKEVTPLKKTGVSPCTVLAEQLPLHEAAAVAADAEPYQTVSDAVHNAVILIVEDNLHMMQSLYQLFAPYCTVITAAHGREALEKLAEHSPSLIISDLVMPYMDGRELYNQCRADESCRSIPFIFLTAVQDEQIKLDLLSDGITDYIQKPFRLAELRLKAFALIDLCAKVRERSGDFLLEQLHLMVKQQRNAPPETPKTEPVRQQDFETFCRTHRLSERERQVCSLLLKGKQNKDIAAELSLATATIATHASSIFRKTGVKNRNELFLAYSGNRV